MKNVKNLAVLVTLVTVSVASAYYYNSPTLRERLTGDTPEVIEAKDKAAIEHQEAQQKANIQQQEAQQKANIQQQEAQQKANIKYKKKNVEIQAKKQQGKFRRY